MKENNQHLEIKIGGILELVLFIYLFIFLIVSVPSEFSKIYSFFSIFSCIFLETKRSLMRFGLCCRTAGTGRRGDLFTKTVSFGVVYFAVSCLMLVKLLAPIIAVLFW